MKNISGWGANGAMSDFIHNRQLRFCKVSHQKSAYMSDFVHVTPCYNGHGIGGKTLEWIDYFL